MIIMDTVILAGIVLALLFNFVNGMNDATNSIATVVATRVLSPLRAVAMAAFFNMVGPLVFTTAVAKTIGVGIVAPVYLTPFVIVIGLFSAVIWVYLSTHLGIPISATHALVGGLVGSAVAYAGMSVIILPAMGTVLGLFLYAAIGAGIGMIVSFLIGRITKDEGVLPMLGTGAIFGAALSVPFVIITGLLKISGLFAIVLFIVLSPLLGFIITYIFSLFFIRWFRNKNPKKINFLSKKLQIFSSAFYSIGHGSNDAQNGMGVITAILVAGGMLTDFIVPVWVILICCSAIALGTLVGGWEVVKTMAKKITHLRPYQGFCAETSGGFVLSFITAFGVPVSTTHAITGAIMGVGATRGASAVHWDIIRRIVTAWIITIPVTAICSFACFTLYTVIFP